MPTKAGALTATQTWNALAEAGIRCATATTFTYRSHRAGPGPVSCDLTIAVPEWLLVQIDLTRLRLRLLLAPPVA